MSPMEFLSQKLNVYHKTCLIFFSVNFRAFAVFPNLTVYTGPMDIDIYVSSYNKSSGTFENAFFPFSKDSFSARGFILSGHATTFEYFSYRD